MTPYISLSLVFIAAGAALLAGLAYLARLVRRHRRSLSTLLKLAQTSIEPLQIPANAWPALADGGIKRLVFSGSWFGQPVQGAFGAALDDRIARPFSFKIVTEDDVSLEFHLYARTDRGEARLFAENLTGVFRLLLETAVHGKMEALSAALSEQARLALYLQHDLRNLAQWVEWLAADFREAQNDAALLCVANRLRSSAPHAAARARRILDATCRKNTADKSLPESVALAEIIRQSAEHAGIAVTIEQDACVLLRRDLLDRTLDNLFANVAPLLRKHTGIMVSVSINQDDDKNFVVIKMPRLAEAVKLSPEKLLEPFASGRPGGLGLGLYQAHKSLHEAGGKLAAEVGENNICFRLTFPITQT